MPNTEITITFGDRDAPKPTVWSMARLLLALVLLLGSITAMATPPAKPEYFGRWILTLGATLGTTLALLAFDAWRTRRRRAGHRWL